MNRHFTPLADRLAPILRCCVSVLALAAAPWSMAESDLIHRYSFNGTGGTEATDSAGGAHGTIQPGATQAGGSVILDGSPDSWVDLPPGLISGATISRNAVTFEAWARFGGIGTWTRLFDFGNTDGTVGSNYINLIPRGGGESIHMSTTVGDDRIVLPGTFANLPAAPSDPDLHIVCVFDYEGDRATLYLDGVAYGEAASFSNATLADVVNNFSYLGRSLYPQWDPTLIGSINEFRIHDGALEPLEVAASYEAGPDAPTTDAGAVTAVDLQLLDSMRLGSQTPGRILASTAGLTGAPVDVTGDLLLGFASSDETILTVDADGVVTAVGAGTATITATYAGDSGSVADSEPVEVFVVDYTPVPLPRLTADITTWGDGSRYLPLFPGSQSFAGVPFELQRDAFGNNVFYGGTLSAPVNDVLEIPVSEYGAYQVYSLVSIAYGQAGETVGSLVFEGSGGLTHTVPLVVGVNVRDHYFNVGNPFANSTSDPSVTENVFGSHTPGTAHLDLLTTTLPAAFRGATLQKVTFSSTPPGGDYFLGKPFLAGLTLGVNAPPVVAITAPESGLVAGTGEAIPFSGSFTDDDAGGAHRAEWILSRPGEEDVVVAATVSGFSVADSLTFNEPGFYDVTLRVTDAAGNVGEADTLSGGAPAYVAIYDASSGFILDDLALQCEPGTAGDLDTQIQDWLGATAMDFGSGFTITSDIAWSGACGETEGLATWTVTDTASGRSTTAQRTVTKSPTESLVATAFEPETLELTLPANTVESRTVILRNAGDCPILLDPEKFETQSPSYAPQLAIVAPGVPTTLCPNEGLSLDLIIDTHGVAESEAFYEGSAIVGSDVSDPVGLPVRIRVRGALLPDLSVNYSDGGLTIVPENSPVFPDENEPFTLRARIRNTGTAPAGAFDVRFFEAGESLGDPVIVTEGLAVGAETVVEWTMDGRDGGFALFSVEVRLDEGEELTTANNRDSFILQVGAAVDPNLVLMHVQARYAPDCNQTTALLTVFAEYRFFDSAGKLLVTHPVQGGSIRVQVNDGNGLSELLDGIHTDRNGFFAGPAPLPSTSAGYALQVEVTDFTVVGTDEIEPTAPNCSGGGTSGESGDPPEDVPVVVDPDDPTPFIDLRVCSADIRFRDSNGSDLPDGRVGAGETVTVSATVHYYHSLGESLGQQPVSFWARWQGADGGFEQSLIETAEVQFDGGGPSDEVSVDWELPDNVPDNVPCSILVEVNPTILQPTANDQATRGLMVGVGDMPQLVVDATGDGCGPLQQWVSGRVTYPITDSLRRELPVICGQVSVRAWDKDNTLLAIRDGYHTDATGRFYFHPAIDLPSGTNRFEVAVFDGTFRGTAEFDIVCAKPKSNSPLPVRDLFVYSQHIGLLESDCQRGFDRWPQADDKVAIAADIQYDDRGSGQGTGTVDVVIRVLAPVFGGFREEWNGTTTVQFPPGGGSRLACIGGEESWTPVGSGPRLIQVLINPDQVDLGFEDYGLNNAATKLTFIGGPGAELEVADPDQQGLPGGTNTWHVAASPTDTDQPTLEFFLIAEDQLQDPSTSGGGGSTAGSSAVFSMASGVLGILAGAPFELSPGISYSFSKDSLTVPDETTLTLHTTPDTPPGRHTFYVMAVGDQASAMTRISLTIVGDTTPPVITLLGDDPLFVECGTAFDDPGATATDETNGDLSQAVTVSGTVDTHTLGDYELTYRVSDAAGNEATLARTVTVRDTTPPVIECPPAMNLAADGSCQAEIPDLATGLVVSDACSDPAEIIVGQTPAAGSLVGLGSHDIVLTATDASGNQASCVVELTVVDTTPPAIDAPLLTEVPADSSCSAAVPDLTAATTATDCNGPVLLAQDPAAGTPLPLGMHAVLLIAVDTAGNTATLEVAVEVIDVTPPTVAGPDRHELTADADCVAPVPDLTARVTATDCNGPVSLTQSPAAGTSLPLGDATATVTALDAAGNAATWTIELSVVDVTPPAVTILAPASGFLAPVNTPIAFSGSFEDCGGPFTAEWQFESAGIPDPPLPGTVSGMQVDDTYAFTEPGVYTIRLRVTDAAGNTGETDRVADDLPAYVVVYDPEGGFVTGGGWIWSPAGALRPGLAGDAEVEGKASFGFVSKYKKGATVPTGQTEFQFKAGDLDFHSSDYQWLVVAGARAQFKGHGEINGEPGYGFMITAIDGKVPGGAGLDRFRIKIWDVLGEGVVYDNQSGSDDGAELDTPTALQGGNIVIHK